MTYKEYYLKCETYAELIEEVKHDIKTAKWINLDRVAVIRRVAEEVINEKFGGRD